MHRLLRPREEFLSAKFVGCMVPCSTLLMEVVEDGGQVRRGRSRASGCADLRRERLGTRCGELSSEVAEPL
jgi:hypothetical protein